MPDQHGGGRPRRQRRPASSTPWPTAERAGADLAVFPELTVTGYPPEDLLDRPAFVADNQATFDRIAAGHRRLRGGGRFRGTPTGRAGWSTPPPCARRAGCVGRYAKRLLPNYGVFDEQRWFTPGSGPAARFVVAGVPVGLTICEDMWFGRGPDGRASGGRCAPSGQPQRLSLLAGPAPRAAGRAGRAGRPRRVPPSSTSTRWGVRTSWSSTGRPWWSGPTGRSWPRPRSSKRRSCSPTSTSTSTSSRPAAPAPGQRRPAPTRRVVRTW